MCVPLVPLAISERMSAIHDAREYLMLLDGTPDATTVAM